MNQTSWLICDSMEGVQTEECSGDVSSLSEALSLESFSELNARMRLSHVCIYVINASTLRPGHKNTIKMII